MVLRYAVGVGLAMFVLSIVTWVLGWWFGDQRRAVDQEYRVVQVLDGRLALGTWQSIALVDLNVDNPDRTVRFSFLSG